MPRFFVEPEHVVADRVRIAGDDASHLARSLRVRRGERLTVVEAGSREHTVEVEEVTREAIIARILASRAATGDPRLRVHVVQALPARGMDDAVESLAVAGARSIRPVITERSVARPGHGRDTARVERWRSIAREAAQLAGRAAPPEIRPVQSLSDSLVALPPRCRILACVLGADVSPIHSLNIDVDRPVALVIGPEGGLGPADIALLERSGAECVHLGPRAAPARLAGFLAVSLLLTRSGDLADAHTNGPEP